MSKAWWLVIFLFGCLLYVIIGVMLPVQVGEPSWNAGIALYAMISNGSANLGAACNANPFWAQWGMVIVAGSCILIGVGLAQISWRKHLPVGQKQTKKTAEDIPMKEPQTIIIREQAVPTGAKSPVIPPETKVKEEEKVVA